MWAGLNAKREEKKNQKGVKVVDLPSVQFLDLFGPPNEVQKTNIYPMQNIILGDIIPNN